MLHTKLNEILDTAGQISLHKVTTKSNCMYEFCLDYIEKKKHFLLY